MCQRLPILLNTTKGKAEVHKKKTNRTTLFRYEPLGCLWGTNPPRQALTLPDPPPGLHVVQLARVGIHRARVGAVQGCVRHVVGRLRLVGSRGCRLKIIRQFVHQGRCSAFHSICEPRRPQRLGVCKSFTFRKTAKMMLFCRIKGFFSCSKSVADLQEEQLKPGKILENGPYWETT